jgi:hypothetical protein
MKAEELHRMTYNALLYSHKDTAAQGYTLWTRGGDALRVTAFDDYFAITDRMTGLQHTNVKHDLMSLDELKTLEKLLRDMTDEIAFDELPFVSTGGEGFAAELHDADALCFPEGYLTLGLVDYIALSPDRLRRLSLLKPAGFPIDMCTYNDDKKGVVLSFRYGPTVRGAIAPLDRKILKGLYQGEEIWAG